MHGRRPRRAVDPEKTVTAVSETRPATPVVPVAPSAPSPAQVAQQARARTPIEVTGAQSLVTSLEASASTPSSASPAARSSRRTTRCSTRPRSGTSWSATSRAPATPPRATRGDRPGRRLHGDLRPGRDQPGHADRRRLHGLGADRRDHRPGRRSASIGTDAFQEADIRGITMPITKHNFLVTDPAEIPRDDRRGVPHRLDRPPRPGARRHRQGRAAGDDRRSRWPTALDLPGYRPVTRPHAKQIREAARLIVEAAPPGALRRRRRDPGPGVSEELRALAELTGIPVVTTLMARGAFPDSHPLHLACPACTAPSPRSAALQKQRPAHRPRRPLRRPGHRPASTPSRPTRKVIHADIDPAEIGKNRTPTCRSSATAARCIADLIAAARGRARRRPRAATTTAWVELLAGVKETLPARLRRPRRRHARPAVRHRAARRDRRPGGDLRRRRRPAPDVGRAVRRVRAARTPGSTPAASAPWASRCRPRWAPRSARPTRTVWAIDGDGCFQMTNQELATCAINDIPIKVAIINNESASAWSASGRRCSTTSATPTPTCTRKRIPDFVKLAEAYGCVGLRCETPERRRRHDRARRWRSTTARSSSTSSSTATRWCGRWSPPAPATTTSRSPATSRPTWDRGGLKH